MEAVLEGRMAVERARKNTSASGDAYLDQHVETVCRGEGKVSFSREEGWTVHAQSISIAE